MASSEHPSRRCLPSDVIGANDNKRPKVNEGRIGKCKGKGKGKVDVHLR